MSAFQPGWRSGLELLLDQWPDTGWDPDQHAQHPDAVVMTGLRAGDQGRRRSGPGRDAGQDASRGTEPRSVL
jgi:hypothetical protein